MKLVFPGAHLTPPDLAGLIQDEHVTLTAGVPTLWLGLLALLDKEHYDMSSLRGMMVGGAAAPQSMIEDYEQEARPEGDARLGHDRDVAAGHRRPAEELPAQTCRRPSGSACAPSRARRCRAWKSAPWT